LRIDNLHYDITADEARELFERIGPVAKFTLHYDRSGRSEGRAIVVYEDAGDAEYAIKKYHGVNAAGQPLSVQLDKSRNYHDRQGGRSLFDRIGPPPRGTAGVQQRERPRGPRGPPPSRGRGRGHPSGVDRPPRRKPKTAEELDAELDDYWGNKNEVKEVPQEENQTTAQDTEMHES